MGQPKWSPMIIKSHSTSTLTKTVRAFIVKSKQSQWPTTFSNTEKLLYRDTNEVYWDVFHVFVCILRSAWCCRCCWQIRYHTASMPPEAYWHAGAAQRFSNRLELFQFCRWQIWTDMLPPVFPGCNNNERLIYKTCSTINSWIDFLLGISGDAVF